MPACHPPFRLPHAPDDIETGSANRLRLPPPITRGVAGLRVVRGRYCNWYSRTTHALLRCIGPELGLCVSGVRRQLQVPGVSSRPGEFHPQALPEPCVNLSIHTAPDARPRP